MSPILKTSTTPYFTRQQAASLPTAANPFKEMDLSFVLKELRRDKEPDGYAPLSLKYRKWAILPPLPSLAKIAPPPSSIFTGTDVIIVPDSKKLLTLQEITKTESRAYDALYLAIKEGKTPLKIFTEDSDFHETLLGYIQNLMLRPSGRLLLTAITSLPRDVVINKGPNREVSGLDEDPFSKVEWNLEKPSFMICHSLEGKVVEDSPNYLIFAHELIHVLHDDWDKTETLLKKTPANEEYSNLEEQFTISGCKTSQILSENTLRFEFGYLRRVAHSCPSFPPFTKEDEPTIHTAVSKEGLNRIQVASATGLLSEVKKLLSHGANPCQGLYYSLRYGHSDVLDYLLIHGADPNLKDYSQNSLLHQTVALKKPCCLSVFLKHKAQIGAVDTLGRTPLRLAVDKSYITGAEILLKHGADIDLAAHDGKSPLTQAILKGHAAMVRILLNHGAKLDEKSLEALQVLRSLKIKETNPMKKTALAGTYLKVALLIRSHLFKIPRSSRRRA
ncbi:MAG: hypothetical protein NTX49_04625 [Chlamydiae bacterium]|nr:hypothetical protein [Chlamydiota bacterium]